MVSRSALAAFLICFVPAVAFASHVRRGSGSAPTLQDLQFTPGSGISSDPFLSVGTVESLLSTIYAGDVVVCDFGVKCNGSTPTSEWSDVLVFYNSSKGPYVTDGAKDANTAYIFSEGTGLATFLNQYDTGRRGRKGLSSDVVFLNEDASGEVKFGSYEFVGSVNLINVNSNFRLDTFVPEPSALIPLTLLLGGLVLRRRYLLH